MQRSKSDFSNKSNMKIVKFKLETLVEEIMVELTFEVEFEYGDKSINTASFRFFSTIRVLNQGTKSLVLQ